MYLQQQPIPGYWYSNLSGQLIQVRAMLYVSGKRNCIVLEDIYGSRFAFSCGGAAAGRARLIAQHWGCFTRLFHSFVSRIKSSSSSQLVAALINPSS